MEEGYFPVKMKRKDLDEVNDEFSDSSLLSPARKIRRLDADLPPIIEEDERVNLVAFGQSVPSQDTFVEQGLGGSPIVIEELSGGVPENEERAIVLFNPMNNTPLLRSRSPLSMSIDSDFLSGYKNLGLWSNRSDLPKPLESETEKQDDKPGQGNGCLAVVPWVPNHFQHLSTPEPDAPQADVSEMMDADVTEATTMDIEDDNSQQPCGNEFGSMGVCEGLNQWQQHCMIPQPPHNLSTPVAWSGRGV